MAVNPYWPYVKYGKHNRPYCELCGPFRGPLLRKMPYGEYRCYGCDNE